MLDVIARSQRGRICKYKREKQLVSTPYIMKVSMTKCDEPIYIQICDRKRKLYIMGREIDLDTDIMIPESSNIVEPVKTFDFVTVLRIPYADDVVIPEETEVLVISNAYELRKDARKLVKTIIDIRSRAGYNVLICMLGIADPSSIPMLSYMGIDIFDDSVVRVSGTNKILSIPEGNIVYDENMKERNLTILANENSKIHDFIKAGRLRELVDQRAAASSYLVSALRLFDAEGYAYQEEACSTVGCRFACNTTQSLRRPEVLRYRKMILERYLKPKNKRILLLLPCSAKKPYHISKTHKLLMSAIYSVAHHDLIHEVIVTSPLGAVPRELDVLFPPKSYDIPVTGEWKCEEKSFIRKLVSHIANQGYDYVVSHLGKDTELIDGICDIRETAIIDPISPTSLSKLRETLEEIIGDIKAKSDYCADTKESIRSILSFQFGRSVADSIMDENTTGVGKFPHWKIMRNGVQLGMLSEERGMISLTISGAQILAKNNTHIVEMENFVLKGDLLAAGVIKSDPEIRIGDETVVMSNGIVRAVGVAAMSGKEMMSLKRGIAVKIRHRS
ncbi:MAG: DUF5591 domain-containing protein [archaeon]|nr:DUF5591 domain-containing protein [archaeon]